MSLISEWLLSGRKRALELYSKALFALLEVLMEEENVVMKISEDFYINL